VNGPQIMVKPAIIPAELLAAARRQRDRETSPEAVPPFSLSEVRRRQRRASPLVLLIFAAWIASQFAAIMIVRPLMVAKSDWYGLLLVLYLLVSIVIFHYGIDRVHRWVGLRCPYCESTFRHNFIKRRKWDPSTTAEDDRRCGRCQAVIIDLGK
jgi:hypothetical protein